MISTHEDVLYKYALHRYALRKYNHYEYMNKGGNLTMVFDKIKAILVDQLDVEEDIVTMEASISDDLGADSLDIADIVMSLEEEFDIEVPDEVLANVKTVGDIVKYIEENVE